MLAKWLVELLQDFMIKIHMKCLYLWCLCSHVKGWFQIPKYLSHVSENQYFIIVIYPDIIVHIGAVS